MPDGIGCQCGWPLDSCNPYVGKGSYRCGKARHEKQVREAKKRRDLSDTKRIGFALAQRREQAGLSRKALAEAVGTSPAHLAAIERGTVDPRLSLVLRLGSAIGWVIR